MPVESYTTFQKNISRPYANMLPPVGGLIAIVMLTKLLCLHNSREGQDVPEIEDKVSALAGAELVSTDRLTGQWHWLTIGAGFIDVGVD